MANHFGPFAWRPTIWPVVGGRGSCVFGAANGFVGVWYMNDKTGTAVAGDAAAGHNGTMASGGSADNTSSHAVGGASEGALRFDGPDEQVNLGNGSDLYLPTSTMNGWFRNS